MKKLGIILFLVSFICNFSIAQNTLRNLGKVNWEFRKYGDSTWLSAKVPGNVHSDLLSHKIIPDPFLAHNEKLVQWVENEDWVYATTFELTAQEFANAHIDLKLENIDTYSKIYLNGQLLVQTENQFRIYNLPIKQYVKQGKNKLTISFESSVKKGKAFAQKLPYTLPGNEAVFTRKAQYQYGWDWGPRLVTCGIGKIELAFWHEVKLENTQYKQQIKRDSLAEITFTCSIFSEKKTSIQLVLVGDSSSPNGTLLKTVYLEPGYNSIDINYKIIQPKLWWSNGLGSAHLYPFKIMLFAQNNLIEKEKLAIGIRTIELVRKKDEKGTSFEFWLNNKRVFMKGANYIPPHSFMNGLDKDVYTNTVLAAKEANMNMLRVWGGGVYADEEFYKACDENGILVWQDFMFACAMYPGDAAFVENVKAEVTDQVIRLRNHTCIALWCGNNEIDEGWKNWGWQKQYKYSQKDSAGIEQDYLNLFAGEIPAIIKKEDSTRAYWPSSPSIGWGRKESLTQGDSHYWGIWWGMEPFENYEKKVGRFMSEYGFQGMPPVSTFEKFMPNFSTNFDSASYKNHQKHPTGYQTISTYMARDYTMPTNFEDEIYVSQLLQARGMKTAIEAHRRAMPYCMGTLFWQLNDCWPVTSWSSIDYYGNKKAVYYQVKKSFANRLISFEESTNMVKIFLVLDQTEALTSKVKIKLIDFYGAQYDEQFYTINIEPNTNKYYIEWPKSKLNIVGKSKNELLLNVQWVNANDSIETNFYFAKPKDLLLPEPNIKMEILANNVLEISSKVLAKDLYLSLPNMELPVSDNFMDILPNQKTRIQLNSSNIDPTKIKIKTLYDIQSAQKK